jgi:ATP-dependent Lon protease
MITRSKANVDNSNIGDNNEILDEIIDDIDENGNIKGFIDYDMKDDPKALEILREHLYGDNGSNIYKPTKKKHKKQKQKKNKINEVFINYLLLKANETLKKNKRNKKSKSKKSKVKITEEPDDNYSTESITSDEYYDTHSENEKTLISDEESGEESLEESLEEEEEEDSVNEESFEEEESDIEESDIEGSDIEITIDEECEDKEIINYEDTVNKNKLTVLDIILGDTKGEISDNEYSDPESDAESEYEFEFDELDDKYNELIDENSTINAEENDIKYFHHLETENKTKLIQVMKNIYDINGSNIPLRFKVINSEMDIKTKAAAISNIDKLADMDISSGEYNKMDHWINGLIRIPFGKYQNLPVLPDSSIEDKRNFITQTHKKLDKAIYGHKEAKTHILQVIGKWIKNPDSGGNVLAIQGPMGNGKTTLVKEGISKVLNRPFAFIALGGASDSAYFDGHSYTYEGSHWGRIVQILQESKCMNPVIYFDELDKVSETSRGEEIIHMLTHLTDPCQNSLFQDNYFPGIDLDLSKSLFIFSYNDESRVNKILKDRMYVIHTKGFKIDDKLKISREYLIPEIMKTFDFKENEIIFTDEILKEIIEKYTNNEEGVRNLKRCFETIISKINIYMLSHSPEDNKSTEKLSFQLKDFKLPLQLTNDYIQILLKVNQSDKPPEHMYI